MPPQRVAIVGSGYMGGGIAQVLARGGHTVVLSDVSGDIARSNLDRLRAETDAFVAAGLMSPDEGERIEAGISAAESIESAVESADVIEEAVPEKLELKRTILEKVSRAAAPDAIIGSNTSTIPIGAMAEAVVNPERFLGVHFSNPAPFIPGVELIPHAGTSEAVLDRAEQLIASTGKKPARVADHVGFVLNRLQFALFHEAAQIVEEGIASADAVDVIARTTFGFRLPFFGPFAIADMAGLDVYAACFASLQTEWPDTFDTPASLQELIDAGKYGTKTGGGYLDIPTERIAELVAYRNKAYVEMQRLLDELGEAPVHTERG